MADADHRVWRIQECLKSIKLAGKSNYAVEFGLN